MYNSGIYSESGNSNESQAVKIIGFTFLPLLISIIPIDRWGEENSTPYWILQNRYFFSIFHLYIDIFFFTYFLVGVLSGGRTAMPLSNVGRLEALKKNVISSHRVKTLNGFKY